MEIYPAIDLKDGNCVRLLQGDLAQSTIFNQCPKDQAVQFIESGATWIHVVDLNGAFEGQSMNQEAISLILAAAKGKAKVQLGGGIRNLSGIEYWLTRGVDRVILGTVAVREPDIVKEACRTFPGKIAVGIDARKGDVAVSGWVESGRISALELAKLFENEGVSALIYTDIERDGMMSGPNADETARLARSIHIPVIASGGVASMQDIYDLWMRESGISGSIIGRALYDGTINLREAIKTCAAWKRPC